MLAEILVFLYFFFSLMMLPYGYNLFYMVFMSHTYKSPITNKVRNHNKVTIQLPVYNEKFVVSRLIDSVCEIDWPKDKMEILILDDSTDETKQIVDANVSEKLGKGFDIQVIRRDNRIGFKAGALQNALKYSSGKYLAIIDADFTPPKDFLEQTVFAIESDDRLGFVQARWDHINRSYSKYTEAFALAIDGYHLVEQSARSSAGLMLNFNGSAGLLRIDAINDVGGWSYDTLSEDLDLSYHMQIKGWKSMYLRDLTVKGEIPATMGAFRTQQARWARGSIQCAKKLLREVWKSQRSFLQKVEAHLHLTYYTVSLWMFATLLVTVPLLAMNKFPYVTSFWYVSLFTLCTISSFTLYLFAIKRQDLNILTKLPYMGLLALIGYGISAKVSIEMIGGLFRKGGSYQRVPKFNIVKKGDKIDTSSYGKLRELPWLEMMMMVYTALGIMFAFMNSNWGIMLYLFIYFGGYFTVAYGITPL